MVSFPSHMKHVIILWLLFLGVFSVAYAPAINGHYAFHDDYFYWEPRPDGGLHPQHMILIAVGRHVGAWILSASQILVHHVPDLNILRFLSVVILSFCAIVLYCWVKPVFQRAMDAFLFVGFIFILPPYQSIVGWAMTMYVCMALLFSILAAHYALKSYRDSQGPRGFYAALSFIFLLLSMLTYQSTSMFYWAMVAFRLLFVKDEGGRPLWRQLGHFFLIGLCAMAVYALILKTESHFYAGYLNGMLYDPYDLTKSFWAKCVWFIREPLYNVVNLWNIFPNMAWVFITCLFFAISGVVAMGALGRRKDARGAWGHAAGVLGCFLILVVLSYLPNLLSKQNAPFYRTCMGIQALVVFAWLWSIRHWLQLVSSRTGSLILTGILILAFQIGVYRCFENVLFYRTLPARMELAYAVKFFASHDLDRYQKLVIIRPALAPFDRYDEFGMFSTYCWSDMEIFVRCAVSEAGKSKKFVTIVKYPYIPPERQREIDSATLVLDMRIPERAYERFIGSFRSL